MKFKLWISDHHKKRTLALTIITTFFIFAYDFTENKIDKAYKAALASAEIITIQHSATSIETSDITRALLQIHLCDTPRSESEITCAGKQQWLSDLKRLETSISERRPITETESERLLTLMEKSNAVEYKNRFFLTFDFIFIFILTALTITVNLVERPSNNLVASHLTTK